MNSDNIGALMAGFCTSATRWLERGGSKKSADETLRGIGLGALTGASVGAGAALPVLFGRASRRLPTRVLNKMLIGRALSGAAIGGVAGGIASRPKDNTYHYYYHKDLKEKGLG
ncbi:MAG: hypothetical protein K8I82_08855 [Anaerolineae bacterium]|nr:hypothetical protein [Anaerolineae bacterium]